MKIIIITLITNNINQYFNYVRRRGEQMLESRVRQKSHYGLPHLQKDGTRSFILLRPGLFQTQLANP